MRTIVGERVPEPEFTQHVEDAVDHVARARRPLQCSVVDEFGALACHRKEWRQISRLDIGGKLDPSAAPVVEHPRRQPCGACAARGADR
jgi:hypothetical protein